MGQSTLRGIDMEKGMGTRRCFLVSKVKVPLSS